MASFSARQEDPFQKCLSKTDLPFRLNVKLGSEKLYLFLAEKMVVCLLVVILCQVLAYFKKLKHSLRAEKDAFKEKSIQCTAWKLLNPLYKLHTQILQIYWIYKDAIELTSRWKVHLIIIIIIVILTRLMRRG